MKVSTIRNASVVQVLEESRMFSDGSWFMLVIDNDDRYTALMVFRCIRDTADLVHQWFIHHSKHRSLDVSVREVYEIAYRVYRLAAGGFRREVRSKFLYGNRVFGYRRGFFFSLSRWEQFAGHESAVLPGAWLLPVGDPPPNLFIPNTNEIIVNAEYEYWFSDVERKLNGEY